VQRFFHRADDLGMLAHRQIIVRTPNGDRLGAVMSGKAARVGIGALVAQDIDEDAGNDLRYVRRSIAELKT